MEPRRIAIHGLMSYRGAEPTVIDFDQLPPGLIAVRGDNGAGKSTLLELMGPAVLFRQWLSRPDSLTDCATRRDAYVELVLDHAGAEWRARLEIDPGTGRPGSGKQEAYLWRDGAPVLHSGKVSEYDAYVAAHFPSLALLASSVFSAQNRRGNFLELAPRDRKDFFVQLLGLEHLQRLSEAARERRKALEADLDVLNREAAGLDDRRAQRRKVEDELANAEHPLRGLEAADAAAAERHAAAVQARAAKLAERDRLAAARREAEERRARAARDRDARAEDRRRTEADLAAAEATIRDADAIRAAATWAEELRGRRDALAVELRAVEAEIEAASREVARFDRELGPVLAEIERLDRALAEAEAVTARAAVIQARAERFRELSARRDALRADQRAADQEAKAAQTALGDVIRDRERAEAERLRLSSQLERIAADAAALPELERQVARLEDLRSQRSAREAERGPLVAEAERLRQVYADADRAAHGAVERAERALAAAREQAALLSRVPCGGGPVTRADGSVGDCGSCEFLQQAAAAAGRLSDLECAVSEARALERSRDVAEATFRAAWERVQDLDRALAALDAEIRSLAPAEPRLAEARARAGNEAALRADCAAVEARIVQLGARADELRAQAADAERRRAAAEAEAQALAGELDALAGAEAEARALDQAAARLPDLRAARAAADSRRADLSEARAAAEAGRNDAELRRGRLRDDLAALDRDLAPLAGAAERLRKLEAAEQRLPDLRRMVETTRALLARAEADLAAVVVPPEPAEAEAAVRAADAVVAEAAGALRAAQEALRAQREEVARLRGRLDALGNLDTLAAALDARRQDLGDEIAAFTLLEQAFGRTGIQALQIDAAGPEVSALCNDLLAACYGTRFTVEVVTQEETTRRGVFKEVFDLRIYDARDGGEVRTPSGLSVGERTIIHEAIGLAIALFNARRSGTPLRTLWRDECDGGLDAETAARYPAMLRRALEIGGFSRLYFISHRSDVASQADGTLWVRRGGDVQVFPYPIADLAEVRRRS